MICPTVLSDTRLYEALLKFDEEMATEAREARCPWCGGALHSARYARKPRGSTVPLPEGYCERESLCCAEDGCRRRVTPPSVRFLGRKVYLGVVIVIVTAMKHGITASRAAVIAQAVGASRETVARWRQWWTELFVKTPFWSATQSLLAPRVAVCSIRRRRSARAGGEVSRLHPSGNDELRVA
jgi:hypothetical protein